MDNIEVSVDGFEAAFASRQEPAWHGLGTVFDHDVTTEEMLKLAHLDNWDVRLEPLEFPEGHRPVTDHFALLRTNPFDQGTDVLSIVGQRYRPYQNEELLAFGDAILDGGGRWETGGSIKQGRQVFASLLTNLDDLVLDPNGAADVVKNYLLLHTSHDGSTAIQAANTPVRVVCQNTLNIALRGVKQSFKIRHTQTAEGKVQAAREALGIQVAYFDEFAAEAQSMIETTVTDDKFLEIVTALYPKPDEASKAAVTRWNNKVETLEGIYLGNGDGPNTTDNIRGTAWGVFNALTESLDWYRKPRKGSAEAVLTAASGFDPVINAEKARIRKAVLALT